ncbi:MAG TPA: hypothetical protein VGC34_19140 [Steroidobacteraceae bacterium]
MSEFGYEGNGNDERESGREGEPGSEHAENGERETLTLSATDFSALEQRILRAVEVVRRERLARVAAEEHAARAEAELREQLPILEQLGKEVSALRLERDQVRQRVERLLGQLDALEL